MSEDLIKLNDGAGGEAMQAFLRESIIKHLLAGNESPTTEIGLKEMDDSCVSDDVVFTIDSHTVHPLFFPGGDIGSLSVAGTVNDISVMGARPAALALGMVIKEGFSRADLETIVRSIGETSRKAGVPVLTGDTKVVDKDAIDGMILTTSAFGLYSDALKHNNEVVSSCTGARPSRWLVDSNVRSGDKIILTGHIGDHGIALMSVREGLAFDAPLVSDVAPLNWLIEAALRTGGLTACKDPTRGGLANTLNEWAEKSGVGIEVREKDIPIRDAVQAACEMMGLNPYEIGNEGKCVMAVAAAQAEAVLEAVRKTPEGADAAIIGEAKEDVEGVVLRTLIGSRRVLEPPIGDPIPRIC